MSRLASSFRNTAAEQRLSEVCFFKSLLQFKETYTEQDHDSPFVPYYCLNCPPSLLPWLYRPSLVCGTRSNTCKHTHARAHGGRDTVHAPQIPTDPPAVRKGAVCSPLDDLSKNIPVSLSFFPLWYSWFSYLIEKRTEWKMARSHISQSAEVTPFSRFFPPLQLTPPAWRTTAFRPAQPQQQVSQPFQLHDTLIK